MRILHYMAGIPPVRGGGMIRYAIDLMRQQMRMGGDVHLMIPGVIPKDTGRAVKIKKCRKAYMQVPVHAVYNPLPIPMCNGIVDIGSYTRECGGEPYRSFLQRLRPDIIHIHTLMGLHREFLAEASRLDMPMVFTTHDYFGLCPAANMVFAGHICEDDEWKKCGQCCSNAYSPARLRMEQSRLYRFYRTYGWMADTAHKVMPRSCLRALRAPDIAQTNDGDSIMPRSCLRVLRAPGIAQTNDGEPIMECGRILDYQKLWDYYRSMFYKISFFHFNSTTARDIYKARLGDVQGAVINISHAGICDHRRRHKYGRKLRLGYFGGWIRHKGVYLLLEACGQMYEEGFKDMELHIYSDAWEQAGPFVVYHKKFQAGQMEEVFHGIDLLVVPSIWPETFGLVALEAVSFGVPVLISKQTGASDILSKYPGCGRIYDGTAEGLKRVLTDIYENRQQLCAMNTYILQMDDVFDYRAHVEEIMRMYRKVMHGTAIFE